MLRGIAAAIVLLHLATAESAAAAPAGGKLSPQDRYHACMDQVATDADEALRTARAWQTSGGGDAARHCAAAAEIQLGQFAEAAEALERLAHASPKDNPALRASLHGQAAHAWLAADAPDKAEAASTEALTMAPGDASLLVLRARARAAQRRLADAIADLDQAIIIDPKLADAYVFRASALRQEKALDSAAADLDEALMLDPGHPEALLERGIIRLLKGDGAGARADWQALIAADSTTPAAESARLNLQRIDEGGRGAPR
jgi:tetratricopeptide (TPR) repeat protein